MRRELSDNRRALDSERMRARECERIVGEYKAALEHIEGPHVQQMRNILAAMELKVASSARPVQSSFGKQNQNNQTDEQDEYISAEFMESIKHQVAELIAIKE